MEKEETQVKGTENKFNKIIGENVSILQHEVPIKLREEYWKRNRLQQKRNHITHDDQNIKCTEQKEF